MIPKDDLEAQTVNVKAIGIDLGDIKVTKSKEIAKEIAKSEAEIEAELLAKKKKKSKKEKKLK